MKMEVIVPFPLSIRDKNNYCFNSGYNSCGYSELFTVCLELGVLQMLSSF